MAKRLIQNLYHIACVPVPSRRFVNVYIFTTFTTFTTLETFKPPSKGACSPWYIRRVSEAKIELRIHCGVLKP
ncbi:hypothetical protein BofuT4_uP007470.1 [Botrytis cinerea T4]|uniref:Uncharacterized protein n=1 Tax=Botryotinia fuckeliana (strain T4) TaxID=999810 RepID=G2XXJ1_BOTF4|nr:hypothetical protein BofuT4_uP007470.1 [Botrytis cinerea T4]